MKAVKPWRAGTECPVEGFAEFKRLLLKASFHNAADGAGEMKDARKAIQDSANVAIEQEWPYWAMERMFKEIQPLVAWDQFMQKYITILMEKTK